MLHVLQKVVQANSEHPFLGHRPMDVDGNAHNYVWETYAQVYQRIENIAAGLLHHSILEWTEERERPVAIYMKNRSEWVLAQYADMYCGGFAVALYDTLGVEAAQHSLREIAAPRGILYDVRVTQCLGDQENRVDVASRCCRGRRCDCGHGIQVGNCLWVEDLDHWSSGSGGSDESLLLVFHPSCPTPTACCTLTHPWDLAAGTVGPPTVSNEIKLVSIQRRGEICFRGPAVFAGYYKAPENTAEAIDADGWLHSGEIGVWTLDGRLKIVDRKKNLFKLSQGEYVAPEKVENIFVTCPYVAQLYVYGDSLHAVLMAIVVPDEVQLLELAKSLGVSGSLAEVCTNELVVAAVLANLVALSKKGQLYGFETVKAIKLYPTPFTLKRNEAKKAFVDDIDRLYEQCKDFVAGSNMHQA
ncbi:Aste57867_11512 [Aphanomyces stellatus]|uniref:Aste57867_11512 protein n=1 Tax=Aphanomyces stellatus TaxID=120398 RepID=A0A485KTK8_9STRA|nr:hypothetical protein As57867_011469 [Aphanomyces stellatus]VFT88373.1 Aste57867_11512 [Aphanomyces stellatus]